MNFDKGCEGALHTKRNCKEFLGHPSHLRAPELSVEISQFREMAHLHFNSAQITVTMEQPGAEVGDYFDTQLQALKPPPGLHPNSQPGACELLLVAYPVLSQLGKRLARWPTLEESHMWPFHRIQGT